ncbi:transmembrane prolyl 4-hydroxylase-like isoform X2 [Xenia sp. Carnegie-2017]|nr:transmembrane prolyl 4-hydroxylase-like isoform X2 [Xenia sp. Carnegie-2017]
MSKYLVPLLLFLIILFCFTNSSLCDNVGDECPQMDRECLLKYYENLILPRRDPGEVGKITSLTLENGEVRKMKTLSIKPPIFEIPNYLSEAECDDIIEIAKNQGLETSVTFNEDTIEEIPENKVDDHDLFVYYDYNNDEHLDVKEVFNLLDTEMDFSPDREDIIDMFEKLQLDENSDLLISMEEFRKRNLQNIFQYVSEIKERKPYTKSRNSNQTWLDTDDDSVKTLQSLRLRLLKLTQLPMVLLNTSESLQVVKYDPKGHYNCHLDSDDISDEAPCCHVRDVENCRICRYLTVLYFLNDVEEGGETAFPIADNITYDDE